MSQVAIYNEDCVWGMTDRIQSESVDCVVTSPPYNIGVDYEGYNDSMAKAQYHTWTRRWTRSIHRVLSPDGSFFLNLGSRPSDPGAAMETLGTILRDVSGWKLQNVIHWVKSVDDDFVEETVPEASREITHDLMVGHIKPIQSKRYLSDAHEYVFHLTKTGSVPLDRLAVGCAYSDPSNLTRGTRGKNGNVRCRGNVWYVPYETIKSRKKDRPHPASFPLELPRRCFLLHGVDRIRLAMDPFSGIGTSALAAQSLGIDFVGFEISPEYHAVSLDRAVRQYAGV